MSTVVASRKQNDAYVYHRQEGENVLDGVIHVRVHSSVRVICAEAFLQCWLLMSVELHNGIKVIEEGAF
jgi:hypothetical protein